MARVKRKAKQGRYEVYTQRDLHEVDRSGATRLLKITIVLAMAGILTALHRPLTAAITTEFPWLGR